VPWRGWGFRVSKKRLERKGEISFKCCIKKPRILNYEAIVVDIVWYSCSIHKKLLLPIFWWWENDGELGLNMSLGPLAPSQLVWCWFYHGSMMINLGWLSGLWMISGHDSSFIIDHFHSDWSWWMGGLRPGWLWLIMTYYDGFL
jgi:hypothetical protein